MISEFQGDRGLNTSSRGCPNFASFFPTSLCKHSSWVGANVPEKAQQMGTAPWKSGNDGNWKRHVVSTVISSEFFGTSSGYITGCRFSVYIYIRRYSVYFYSSNHATGEDGLLEQVVAI